MSTKKAATTKAKKLEQAPIRQLLEALAMMGVEQKRPWRKALEKFHASLAVLRKQIRRDHADLDRYRREAEDELDRVTDQIREWRALISGTLEALQKELADAQERYRSFGKKGSHADIIRHAIRSNIANQDYAAAAENITSLIKLYDPTDDAK